jgi:hypothetical protein
MTLESKTQSEVKRIFDELTISLGAEVFHKIFNVILTNGGSEFQSPVVPKRQSFNEFTQEKITLLQNHINSQARDSLNGCTPYKLSTLLLDQELHKYLKLVEIAPDDVTLIPELLN